MRRKRTRTLDDATFATDPGEIKLSHTLLRIMRPDLYGIKGIRNSILVFFGKRWAQRKYIEEQLHNGDSRAAVVISADPLLVAAYTDELDCVAMLRFPIEFVRLWRLSVGSRLLTVNCYGDSPTYDSDLILGPNLISRWTGFHPIIAEFVSEDYDRIEDRKNQISDDEWRRAGTMGWEYVRSRPGLARDGRPVLASIPAIKRRRT